MTASPARLLGLSLRYNPRHWQADPLRAHALERARALEASDLRRLDWQGLLGMVDEALALALPLAGTIRRRELDPGGQPRAGNAGRPRSLRTGSGR